MTARAALTPIVDRPEDVEAILGHLGRARLVTLTGPGGVGKSRLAMVVLERAVELGLAQATRLAVVDTLASEASILSAVATTLGLRGTADSPNVRDLVARLPLEGVLLLVDGCDLAPTACGAVVETLLRASDGVRVLTTSQQPLGIRGEQYWPVAPLSLPSSHPDADEALQADSVRLFVDRMSALQPHFRLTDSNAPSVATVCRVLDGLPLALELAAVQAARLGLEQVAARVAHEPELLAYPQHGAPERHHSLVASISRGWGALDEEERHLARRLAVFDGGCTLAGAEAVCARDGVQGWSILNMLQRLITKSMVFADTGAQARTRYRMLRTVRGFALQQLETPELTRLRDAHLRWFTELAEAVSSGEMEPPTAPELTNELENIRVALEWSRQSGAAAEGLRLTLACAPLWLSPGLAGEGLHWVQALSSAENGPEPARYADAVCLRGALETAIGDSQAALSDAREAVRLADANGERLARARARCVAGEISLRVGEIQTARAALEAAAALTTRDAGALAVHVLARLVLASLEDGDLRAARTYASAAMEAAQANSEPGPLARAHRVAAALAHHERKLAPAAAAFTQAIGYARQVNLLPVLVEAIHGLLRVEIDLREISKARALATELVPLAADVSMRWFWPSMIETIGELATPPTRAARLAATAEAYRERIGVTAWPSDTARRAAWLDPLRAQLGPRWLDIWSAGRLRNRDEALRDVRVVLRGGERPGEDQSRLRLQALSPRERQVAELVAVGLSNHAIAEMLRLSDATVRVHVEHVLEKLGLHSRVQVARRLDSGHAGV